MDSLVAAAGRALAVGDALGALKRVALREDPPSLALREYTAAHAKEMKAVIKKPDDDTVAAVISGAEAGTLTNILDGESQSAGHNELLA